MARKKQGELPGIERKKIKEVEDAAAAYVDARDKRMELTEKEVEAHDALLEVMQKHKLTVYRDPEAVPPLVVTLKPGKTKVKVETLQDGEGEE